MKRILGLLALLSLTSPAWAQTPTTPAIAAMVCANNTVVPTPVNGQFFYVQCDSNGKLITTASGGGVPSGPAGGSLKGTYPNPGLADVNSVATSLAIGGATIGTDALGVTGTATISGQLNAASFVPTGSTIPINGMYLVSANTTGIAVNSGRALFINSGGLSMNASSAAQLTAGNASATSPSIIPNRADATTGIGAQASGNVSIIAGALEQARYGTAAASVATVLWPGVGFTGGSGTTTFPQLFVQPTGTSAVTTWSTSGTGLGMNLASGFAGNFLDFHVAGGSGLFKVDSSGNVNAFSINGSGFQNASVGTFTWLSRGILSSPATGAIQLGAADAAAPVAQTLRAQSVVAGTSNTAGVNWTQIAPLSTGSGISGDYIVQTGGTGAAATVQNSAVNALIVKGATQEVRLPAIASDAGLTDTTMCQDTTNHGIHAGSGTLGICLGTSGRQFKTAFEPMAAGLDDLMKINFVNYHYKSGFGDNGQRLQYGATAQDVEAVLPDLARHDTKGETINYDSGALLMIGLRAIQQLKADNDNLRHEIEQLKQARR